MHNTRTSCQKGAWICAHSSIILVSGLAVSRALVAKSARGQQVGDSDKVIVSLVSALCTTESSLLHTSSSGNAAHCLCNLLICQICAVIHGLRKAPLGASRLLWSVSMGVGAASRNAWSC